MKRTLTSLIAVAFISCGCVQAQSVPVWRASAPDNAAPGTAAYRHGMALILLGPVKMALGVTCVALLASGFVTGNTSGFGEIMYGVIGGFHLLSGIGCTVGGAHLLKKAKRQRAQGSSNVSISIPDLKINYPMAKGAGMGLGLHTTVVF